MRDAPLPDPWSVPFVTVAEAGRLLHLSRSAAYRAAGAGELPTVRVAGRLRVAVSDLYRVRRLPLPVQPAESAPVIVWSAG